ncbi:MAG TPA: hypothetical protein VKD89_01080 [Candidatus Udaeobacter sp.]|nr:hypothetical protein [Candidatus Udaeobacter sp.]
MKTNDKNQPSVGRPTKYSQETIERLCEALADGLPIKGACVKAGIGVTTLNEWRDRYPEVNEQIEEARECYREKAIQTINRAIKNDDWRAAQAALKMFFPEEYREGAAINVNATAQVSGFVITEPERLKLIEARRRLALQRAGAA